MSKCRFLFWYVCIGVACFSGFSDNLEIRIPTIPPFSNFVNRLTNSTFGIVRDGIGIFTNTVDRITSTVSQVDDRLRQILEEARKVIIKGIPEINVPILDPLHVDKIDFNVIHESTGLKGSIENITVRHISKFVVDNAKFTDIGRDWLFRLDLDVTLPFLRADGLYDVDGSFGDTIKFFGKGRFWLKIYNLSVNSTTLIKFGIPKTQVVSVDLQVKMQKMENNFENLMNDKETGDLFNKAIADIGPEALDILWPEVKAPVQNQTKKYINGILENATIASLIRRLLNIRL